MMGLTIRYGVLSRKFLLPSISGDLLTMIRREFLLADNIPLGLTMTPEGDESLMVVPFDLTVLRRMAEQKQLLDLRVYAVKMLEDRSSSKVSLNSVVAQFDFDGQGDSELSFKTGDCIEVISQYSEEWWKGRMGTQVGYFPANYVSGLESVSVSQPNDSCNYQDDEYFEGYNNLSIHLEMLQDSSRTTAYRRAIMNASDYIKGKVVLDIGCGSSILSIFCAQAGAKHVYAVEASNIFHQASLVVKENNLSDRITVIQGKVEEIELPVSQVDVIVSEWMGTLLICESMIASVLYARKKFLKKGGLMLPTTSDIIVAPLCIEDYYQKKVGFWDDVYGVKMSCLKSDAIKEFFSKPTFDRVIEQNEVIASPVTVSTVDMTRNSVDDLEILSSSFEFLIQRSGIMHGFGGWFDSFFAANPESSDDMLKLSTSPSSTPTHWKQVMFVLENPVNVEKDTWIRGKFQVTRQKFWRRHFEVNLSFSIGEDRESIVQSFPLWR